jgi:hypothetical protein
MPKITVVTLALEDSDQTIADGIRTISDTIMRFTQPRPEGAVLSAPAIEARPAAPIAALPAPKNGKGKRKHSFEEWQAQREARRAAEASPKAPRRVGSGGKKSPLTLAIERLLATRPHTTGDLRAALAAEGTDLDMKHLCHTLSNGSVRKTMKRSKEGLWSLA